MIRAVLVLAALACGACAPLDTWDPPKVGYIDTVTGCPRFEHDLNGPDAYDRAHGEPYHCEAPASDPAFNPIDRVDE